MKISLWLAGAAGATAVVLGLGTSASAATHHTALAPRAPISFDARHLHMAVLPRVTPGTIINLWAGYFVIAHRNVLLRYVAADFNLPSLNCSGTGRGAEATQMVGLDGFAGLPGEIVAVQGTCNSTSTYSYQGFYEIGTAVRVPSSVAVNPGDAMRASVYYDAGTKKYEFSLYDVTLATSVINVSASCPAHIGCSAFTAEAATDDRFNSKTQKALPLADYGMENFTAGAVTSRDGLRGGFGSSKLWFSNALAIHGSSGAAIATPSSLEGGSAFSTTWLAAS